MKKPTEIEKTEIGQRLRSLHIGQSRLQFATDLGVSDSTVGNYERGERYPDAQFLARLRERTGVDLNWLLGNAEVNNPRKSVGFGEESALYIGANDQAVVLPRYEIRAAAGRGSLVVSENVAEYMSVGRDWLQRNLPAWAPPNAVVGVLEGSGDSMEPTIRDGDLIMLVRDPDWRVVERGGVFVFTVDHDRLLLKRLQIMMNGDLAIISDNKAYAGETVPKSELPDRVIIHGQVFFVGGKPRSFGA